LEFKRCVMKRCTKCGLEKDESEFHRYANSDKPRARCKICINAANLARQAANPEKYNARTRAWRDKNPGRTNANIKAWQQRNPERYRANMMWVKYRIRFEALWEAQGGRCAACGRPMIKGGRKLDSVCVDHDRSCCSGRKSCGKCVRGLIHWSCNLILGHAEDNLEILQQAAAYLKRSR